MVLLKVAAAGYHAAMTLRTTGFRTAFRDVGYGTLVTAVAAGGFVVTALLTGGGCAEAAAAQSAVAASQVASSAVTTTLAGQNPTPRPRGQPSGIKFNGRGGYDISAAQQAVLKRTHWVRDHHNQVFRPSYPKPPSSQPTTQPTPRPS